MPYKDAEKAREANRQSYEKHREERRAAQNASARERYASNPEKMRAKSRGQKKNMPLEKVIWERAKVGAYKKNVPFDLDVEDVVVPEFCPVLGMKLSRGVGRATDASPSIDRIRPELGYTKGNIQIMSFLANKMKNSATPTQLHMFKEWIEREVPNV